MIVTVMSKYFLKGLKDNVGYFLLCAFITLLTGFLFLDAVFYAFHFWIVRITFVSAIGGFFVYLIISKRVYKRKEFIRKRQQEYEKLALESLKQRVIKNPDFHTFCYECRHYNNPKGICTIDIFNTWATKVRLEANPNKIYCLYWNCDYDKIIARN